MEEVRFISEAELTIRVRELEGRLALLEQKVRNKIDMTLEAVLIRQHGDTVSKPVAARILGVTRTTVDNMLKDGRLSPACEGRRVSTRSIAKYMDAQKNLRRRRTAYGVGMD